MEMFIMWKRLGTGVGKHWGLDSLTEVQVIWWYGLDRFQQCVPVRMGI